MSSINLDGGERTLLKALGFGGSAVSGEVLFARCAGFEEAEFVDTLNGLVVIGYISTDGRTLRNFEDVTRASFQVNSGYSRDLKEALNPTTKPVKRRVRRE